MKASLVSIIAVLIGSAAFADIAIECRRSNNTLVSVYDTSNGYTLRDSGNAGLKNGYNVKTYSERPDALHLRINTNNNAYVVFSFKGLKFCQDEGASRLVKMQTIKFPAAGKAQLIERLNCECAAD